MNGRLKNKVAIVTGGASGLGRQSAIRMVEEGALVCVTDINQDEGEETAVMLGERGFFLTHDVSDEAAWKGVIDVVLRRFGKLNALVNCAGVGFENDSIADCDDQVWNAVMDVNLHGTFLGCRLAIEPMRRAGGGSIINLSSVLGLRGGSDTLAYCASKGAVRLLTKSVAVYCATKKTNVRCNSIHPGYMLTNMVRDYAEYFSQDEALALTALHPIGRMGDSDDIAHMVVYLASDESTFVTGAEMVVDGGYTAG